MSMSMSVSVSMNGLGEYEYEYEYDQAGHVSDIHIIPGLGIILRAVLIMPSASISKTLKVFMDAKLYEEQLRYYASTPDF
jgi:hypothetical protein